MKVLLIFPPQFNPTQPYLSLPSLAARLSQEGIDVAVRDLNVEFYHWALSKATVERAVARVTGGRDTERSIVELASKSGGYLTEHVEEARDCFRSEDDFYELGRYHWARTVVAQSLALAGAGWGGASLSLNEFRCRYNYHSSRETAQAARDTEGNVILPFLEEGALPSLTEEEPDLVGISVCSPFQVIGALTLATLLRREMPGVPVILGGGFFTRALHQAERVPGLAGLVDGIVVHEGEEALVQLCDALAGHRGWGTVPNLVRLDGELLVSPNRIHREDVRRLPTPDFRGLPLHLYLSPRPVMPVLTSRGCYWHRCTFCTSYLTYGSCYSARPRGSLLQDLRTVAEQCGTAHFFLADQAVPPTTLKWLADALPEERQRITFYGQTRCDGEFAAGWLGKLREAGCTKLYFGIETGSPAMIEKMAKGIDLERARGVLRLCAQAGIAAHLFFLVGFPGETERDRRRTLAFLESVPEVVGFPGFSMNFAPFGLEPLSAVGHDPLRFGVEKAWLPPGADLPTHCLYTSENGPAQDELPGLVKDLEQRAMTLVRHPSYPTAGPHCSLYLNKAPTAVLGAVSRQGRFPPFSDSLRLRPSVADGAALGHDPQGRPILYRCDGAATRLLSPDGLRLLELCSEGLTLEEICSRWVAENRGKALRAWLLARELWEAGILTI